MTFSTLGSNFSTTLAVYESPPVGAYISPPTHLGAATPEIAGLPAPWNGACQVVFTAVAYHVYYIAVNGTVSRLPSRLLPRD